MDKLTEKLINMGMEKYMDSSQLEFLQIDEIYLRNKEDEKNFEKKYLELDLQKDERCLINKYISCIKDYNKCYSKLSYMVGIKDTVEMFRSLGLLRESKIED